MSIRLRLTHLLIAAWNITNPIMAQAPCGVASGPLTVPPTFFLPIEFSQGAVFQSGKSQLFEAALRAHPSRGFGCDRALRLGTTIAAAYFSPDLEPMGGLRASFRIARWFRLGGSDAGLHLAGEYLWGTRARRTLSGALVADALGLAQFNVRVGREMRDRHWFFELSAGADIAIWRRHSVQRSGGGRRDVFPELTGFMQIVAVQMSIQASWVRDSGQSDTVRGLLGEASGQFDETALKNFFRTREVPLLATTVDNAIESARNRAGTEGIVIPDSADSGNRKALVLALVAGLRKAVER